MDLVVDPAPDGVKLPGTGYTSGSLQDNLTISNDKGLIGGHLKYTTGMVTMYPDDRLKQEGNYIALWLHEIGDPYVNYDKIEAKVVNGAEEKELEVSDEGYICFRVDDRATTKLVVTVTIGDQTYDKEFKLTGLTIDSYGWNILKGTNPTGEDLYQWAENVSSSSVYPDVYSDDGNSKKWYLAFPRDSASLITDGYSITNEEIQDRSGLGNEWIKSQLKIEHTTVSQISSVVMICSSYFTVSPGTTYTLSYYYRGTKAIPYLQISSDNLQSGGQIKDYIFSRPSTISESEFSRYSVSFNSDLFVTNNLGIRITINIPSGSESNVDYSYIIAGLKLEEGDHATGWDDYWSGDNLLLDTDQPDFENHNENIGDSGYREISPSSVSKSVSFLPDGELPYPSALINNKYTITTTNESYAAFRFYGSKLTEGLDLKDGDLLTASFYFKASRPCRVIINDATSSLNDEIAINDTSVNRIVRTYIQKESGPNFNDQFVITMGYFGSTATTFEFYGIKLEKGCHVTDYRPAASDFNINYFLDSGSEVSNDSYLHRNVKLISQFTDIPFSTPMRLSLNGSFGEGKTDMAFYLETLNPVSHGVLSGFANRINQISIDRGTRRYVSYCTKNDIAGMSSGEYSFTKETKVTGIDIYMIPNNELSTSTTSKIKLEVGRYLTKWVDGSGEPVPTSDEEDDDLEIN